MCEMAPVLLPDEHDEWRAVDPSRREGADGVPEARGGVEQHERRFRPPDRPAGRDADDRPLVQPEHELDVRGRRRATGPQSSRGWRTSGSGRALERPRSPRRARSPVPFVRPYRRRLGLALAPCTLGCLRTWLSGAPLGRRTKGARLKPRLESGFVVLTDGQAWRPVARHSKPRRPSCECPLGMRPGERVVPVGQAAGLIRSPSAEAV